MEKRSVIAPASTQTPYRADRKRARDLAGDGEFIEVFCRCGLEVCEERDTRGLYRKAKTGEIPEFTGVSAPYEEPENPEIVLETDSESVDESVKKVFSFLEEKAVIGKNNDHLLSAGRKDAV